MTHATPSHDISTVSYRLFRHSITALQREEIYLCVDSGSDFICVSLGGDMIAAENAYQLMVNGAVTPCTLLDVLDDLGIFYEQCLLLSGADVEIQPVENEHAISEKPVLLG